MGVKFIDEKCNGCGICYDICPMDVFRKIENVVYIAYPDDCMCCYLCEIDCPEDAVHVKADRPKPIPFPY